MHALVLVGGQGTRLRPLTESIPKPVVPLAGRPFLGYLVDWLGRHGIEEVVLACGFMPDTIRDVLGEGEPGGPRIRYIAEPRPLGTAGAIRFAADALGERFVALNGDVLTDIDLGALVRFHAEKRAAASIALHPVDDPSAYGLVSTTEEGEVLEFLEKPEASATATTNDVNAGVYVLERKVLELIGEGAAVSIEHDVFPRLVGKGLYALALEGYWADIGTPRRYLQATWDILEGRVRTAAPTAESGVLIDASASIEPSASVGPRAVVSSGCAVGAGARVEDSVLLDGSSVGAGAAITGSILSPGASVEAEVRLRDAVLAEGERVGTR